MYAGRGQRVSIVLYLPGKHPLTIVTSQPLTEPLKVGYSLECDED